MTRPRTADVAPAQAGPRAALARRVDRVTTQRRLGPDAQVDDKALVFAAEDPRLTDPFLALMEDWFSAPGFEWHPHRGIETVTTVLDGVLEHGDNAGHSGALQAGDVQWMTAGRGIVHRELAYRDEHAHTLQLWLNLPARRKLVETRYQDLTAASRPRLVTPGVTVDVVAGRVGGTRGPARTHWPVQGVLVTLDPGAGTALPVPAEHRAFAHVLSGRVAVAGRRLGAGQTAWSDPVRGASGRTELALRAADGDVPARLMVYSGTPLREPVAFGGPFVMNTRAEVAQAYRDYERGAFGRVPRQARLR